MNLRSSTTPTLNPDPLLNRDEAAEYLGIKPATLVIWACTGRYNLPYIKVGRLARYRKSCLDAFLTRRTVGAVIQDMTKGASDV